MKRRRAISRIFILGATGIAGYSGIKAFKIFQTPDLSDLDSETELLDELAETIIPRTETPGARDAEVGIMIIKLLKDCTNYRSQNKFLSGLEELKEFSKSKFQKQFLDCNAEQKSVILQYFQKDGRPFSGIIGKVHHRLTGDSFFVTLKKYTILGYCTSRVGAMQGLAFDIVPGKYTTINLTNGQKAWATQ